MADDTYVEVGMYYRNGDRSEVEVYFRNPQDEGGDLSKEFATASKNEWQFIGVLDENLPDDEELAITLAVTNGEAVAKVLSTDYIHIAQERN